VVCHTVSRKISQNRGQAALLVGSKITVAYESPAQFRCLQQALPKPQNLVDFILAHG
jgi:hypothetical protein